MACLVMAIEIDLSDSEKINLFQTELNKAAEEKKNSGSVSYLIEENFSTITKLLESQGSDSAYKILVKLFKRSFKVSVKESTLRSYYSKAKKKLEKYGDSVSETPVKEVDKPTVYLVSNKVEPKKEGSERPLPVDIDDEFNEL